MLSKDEGNRPDTNLEGLSSLKPVFKDGQVIKEGRFITAGNASQLSDGASAAVLMEEGETRSGNRALLLGGAVLVVLLVAVAAVIS